MDKFVEFAPLIIVVLCFLLQHRLFVTPEELERKHRSILQDVENRFATLHSFNDLKEQFGEMKEKIDKIYDFIIKKT